MTLSIAWFRGYGEQGAGIFGGFERSLMPVIGGGTCEGEQRLWLM